MATFNILMPKLGESVQEATITKWFKKVGDEIEEEDVLLEIATDKVDSEIPSPVDGKIIKILFEEDALVPVGEVIAVVDLDGDAEVENTPKKEAKPIEEQSNAKDNNPTTEETTPDFNGSDKFYSPLVKNIAKKENITLDELEKIQGTGHNGRIRKEDILSFLENRSSASVSNPTTTQTSAQANVPNSVQAPKVVANSGDEIIAMDRVRKKIAEHMLMSKQVSPHVTNFIEADVTNIAIWRNKIKDEFAKREKTKITYMPIFIEATARALKKFPGINASVDGDNIILRKNVNIGIAVALPNGDLIVPVLKNADQKSLIGLTVDMNTKAVAARENKLSPDDIAGGTFSISNFGSFKNLTGTPIINQPQVAILATGNIEKKPAVVETPTGDVIAIRHKMMLALTYDHRVIDGSLAGGFLKFLADELENFDINRSI